MPKEKNSSGPDRTSLPNSNFSLTECPPSDLVHTTAHGLVVLAEHLLHQPLGNQRELLAVASGVRLVVVPRPTGVLLGHDAPRRLLQSLSLAVCRAADPVLGRVRPGEEIGRASCREGVCQYGYIAWIA